MNQRCAILLMLAVIAACTARVAGPPVGSPRAPKPSREALAAKPVEWSKRAPGVAVVPPSAKHLQLIITPGWARDEQFVWVISEGTHVAAVYRATGKDVGEILDEVTRRYFPTVGTPGDARSFILLGSYKGPLPPPPPEPGGFPVAYVEDVLDAAWDMNRQANQLDLPSAGR